MRSTTERKSDPETKQTLSFALEIRAAKDDGTIEGYGSVFGVRDAYSDIVAAGSFNSSLAAHKAEGSMPAMLWQHNSDEPIGVWTDMVEDEKGLLIRGRLALETVRGREAHALMKMGALNGLSIGFYSKSWQYDRETDVRTLTEVDLWEVSLVTFPANGKARVTQVKAAADDIAAPKDAERILRDAGFSKSDACAFVSRVLRLGEERREAAEIVRRSEQMADSLLLKLRSAAG
jgi:HK97 family phage prohead protease